MKGNLPTDKMMSRVTYRWAGGPTVAPQKLSTQFGRIATVAKSRTKR